MAVVCPFSPLPVPDSPPDLRFMTLAYNESLAAWAEDEVPVGALVVCGDRILAREHNRVRGSGDPTFHGEILALRRAAEAIGDWRLNACTLYTTKEPCPMCSGACTLARIGRVVFGIADPKMGCLGGCGWNFASAPFNHCFPTDSGILANEIHRVLREFFVRKRQRP
jgi:tRNA(adenine34) deaminase